MNQKEQFFFQQASANEELNAKLLKKKQNFRIAILNLLDADVESICQACLSFDDWELATGFAQVRESLDLEEHTAKILKDKKYMLEAYRKSIAASLIGNKLPEVVVWFFINQKGVKL